MIAEKTEESINQAVAYELQNIVKKYGASYNSEHEGYAVLLEEVEEAKECLQIAEEKLKDLWKSVSKKNVYADDTLWKIKVAAINMAQEAVQVAAVCERFEETIKNKNKVHISGINQNILGVAGRI